MKIIQITQPGGPDQMQLVEAPIPAPGPNQALVRVAAAGVNFIDVYFRIGLYKAEAPFTPGNEGAGTIEAVGPGVTDFAVGDRVAWGMYRGSYTQYAVVPVSSLVKLPDGVDFQTGAAAMLQGMTAHYLSHSSFPLKQGDKCLIHAAAGGAGRLLVQMAKMRGATVIGTCGTDEKAAIAKAAGADETIVYTRQDFAEEVKKLTGGKGVDVVYDSVGQSTFLKGLDVIRPRGTMVLFGQSSGAVAPIDPSILNVKGSLFMTRPSLAHHCLTREELNWRAGDVLGWIAAGKLELRIEKTYPLAEAPQAHRDLEGRSMAGKLLLIP
ncbi:MAG: quinone oxidoreductase [Acidobacteriia bacterium]|jgi:NADPH2:quinone reductase|nr:quinone oxidoreductase [Terriglobia bacterium]